VEKIRLVGHPPDVSLMLKRYGVCSQYTFGSMASIIPFIKEEDGAFDAATARLMSSAFKAACLSLQGSGQPVSVYANVAVRIIAATKMGERDPKKLRELALASIDTCRMG